MKSVKTISVNGGMSYEETARVRRKWISRESVGVRVERFL
jgi:hypothetical protein